MSGEFHVLETGQGIPGRMVMQQDDCRSVEEQGGLDYRPAVNGCLGECPS